jgi:hypothetical protein
MILHLVFYLLPVAPYPLVIGIACGISSCIIDTSTYYGELLGTFYLLDRLSSNSNKACPICNGSTESTQHIFLDCILAKALWRSSTWPLDYSSFADLSIGCWVKAILHPHEILHIPIFEVENFQLSVVIALDAIRGAKNNRVHNNVTPHFHNLAIQVQKSIDIHQQAWTAKDLIASWNPPPLGFFKINFDVAVRPNYMVAAAVISDHDGSLLWATAKKLPLLDINAGEAHAALLAVETATSFFSFFKINLRR